MMVGGRRRERAGGRGSRRSSRRSGPSPRATKGFRARTRSSGSSSQGGKLYSVGTLTGKATAARGSPRRTCKLPAALTSGAGRRRAARSRRSRRACQSARPRARADQPQPARAVGAHEPDQPAHRRRAGRRATCSATCCAGSPASSNPHRRAGATRRSASSRRSSTRCSRCPAHLQTGTRAAMRSIAALLLALLLAPATAHAGTIGREGTELVYRADPGEADELSSSSARASLDVKSLGAHELRLGAGCARAAAGYRVPAGGMTRSDGPRRRRSGRDRASSARSAADRRPRRRATTRSSSPKRAATVNGGPGNDSGDGRRGRGDRRARRRATTASRSRATTTRPARTRADGGAGRRRALAPAPRARHDASGGEGDDRLYASAQGLAPVAIAVRPGRGPLDRRPARHARRRLRGAPRRHHAHGRSHAPSARAR